MCCTRVRSGFREDSIDQPDGAAERPRGSAGGILVSQVVENGMSSGARHVRASGDSADFVLAVYTSEDPVAVGGLV